METYNINKMVIINNQKSEKNNLLVDFIDLLIRVINQLISVETGIGVGIYFGSSIEPNLILLFLLKLLRAIFALLLNYYNLIV